MACSPVHLFLEGLQWFKLQTSQFDLDVLWNVRDEETQDELEGQESVLKLEESKRITKVE